MITPDIQSPFPPVTPMFPPVQFVMDQPVHISGARARAAVRAAAACAQVRACVHARVLAALTDEWAGPLCTAGIPGGARNAFVDQL